MGYGELRKGKVWCAVVRRWLRETPWTGVFMMEFRDRCICQRCVNDNKDIMT